MSNRMRALRVKKKQLYSFSNSTVYGEAGPDRESGLQLQEVQEVVELHVVVQKSECRFDAHHSLCLNQQIHFLPL